jgi:hypothetical protein
MLGMLQAKPDRRRSEDRDGKTNLGDGSRIPHTSSIHTTKVSENSNKQYSVEYHHLKLTSLLSANIYVAMEVLDG